MYEQRCIAFIDILGFGCLIEKSKKNVDLQRMIYEALDSLHTDRLNDEAYSRVNVELIPPNELDKVIKVSKQLNEALKKAHPVLITFFSDSVVISAKSDDTLACRLVLDLVAKLSLRFWQDHDLLIRGAITMGSLVHKENGPLFGPAMNRAYYLESKEAIYPRVLIDNEYVENYIDDANSDPMASLINCDDKYSYTSLVSAFKHTLNDSTEFLAGEKVLARHRQSLDTTLKRLIFNETQQSDEKIKSKYTWLIKEIKDSRLINITEC